MGMTHKQKQAFMQESRNSNIHEIKPCRNMGRTFDTGVPGTVNAK